MVSTTQPHLDTRTNVASTPGMRTLNLALQGGGSHGAFTWGVLDALLADARIDFEGISGTSAGAVNAVAFADGWARGQAAGEDPRAAARAALQHIWDKVASWGSLGALPGQIAKMLWGGALSPYQANPLDINPLLDLLEREIDFHAVRNGPLKVFVSATHIRTGKAVIFSGKRLTAQSVMASACLPMLFRAVEIEGEHYWDGGYSVNPALTPLIDSCACADLMLVQINPLRRDAIPHSAPDIADRVSELTFNASLLTQMRSIDLINRLVSGQAAAHPELKAVRMHRIDAGSALDAFPASSRTSADAAMIRSLFEAGRAAGGDWLEKHFAAIGRNGTVNIREDYLDDTRDQLPIVPATATATATPAPKRPPGFRPWLASLLKRRSKDS